MTAATFDVVGAAGPQRYFSRTTLASIAHAYLFSGPAGVGKKHFARQLAQSLLCARPRTNDDTVLGYDGTCSSCKLFAAGEAARHPDFLEHTGVLKIGERDSALGFHEGEDLTARDLVRQLSMRSYSGGLRVLLLGDIDFATHHAANALLKFFEEPPRDIVLLITTATPGRLLSTIRSRLIELRFPPLTSAQVRDILERMGFEAAQAELGAQLGDGSVTRAVAALEPQERSLRAQVAQWFFRVIDGTTPEEGWATRETLDEGLEVVKALLRDWITLGAVDRSAALAAPDYAQTLHALRPVSLAHALAALGKLDEAQRLARTNVSPTLVSELVRMTLTGSASP